MTLNEKINIIAEYIVFDSGCAVKEVEHLLSLIYDKKPKSISDDIEGDFGDVLKLKKASRVGTT